MCCLSVAVAVVLVLMREQRVVVAVLVRLLVLPAQPLFILRLELMRLMLAQAVQV
jgi:hypothetical protein